MTSYQKLKAENTRLKREIYMLIRKPQEVETQMIKTRHECSYRAQDVVWKPTMSGGGIAKLLLADGKDFTHINQAVKRI